MPERFACGPAATDIKAAPALSAPRTSQLLPGETFCVVEISGGWAWGYSGHDHYVGYVEASALTASVAATHVVAAPAALLFAAPDIRGDLNAVLPVGSRVAGTAKAEFLDTGAGYLHRLHVRPVEEPVPDPVALAETLIGMPYLWGGRGAGGLDCSGLVQLAYGLAGIALPRDSDQQVAAGTEASDPRRGDLLLWSDHVVIVRDDTTVIHATSHAMAVVVEALSDLVARAGPPVARRRVM